MLSDMDRLNEELRNRAIDCGLCAKWQSEWDSDRTPQELIDMWKRGIDFGIAHNFPSNDFIKTNFDRTLLHQNLIFVDEHIDIECAPNGVYVLNGECSGTLHFREWAAATVYVRHTSKVSVIAEDFAKVFVRLYDGGEADICDIGNAVVKTYDRRGVNSSSVPIRG